MLNQIKYKGCKRCGGDLFLERDYEGFYVSCLQCGAVYLRRVPEAVPMPVPVPVAMPKRRKVCAR
jgi:hypothetical protein